MWQIEEQVEIYQTPEQVFAYLCHFHLIREWDSTVLIARMTTPGPPAVGSRFKLMLLFGLSRIPMIYEIVSITFPKELVLLGKADTFEATDRIRLEETPHGSRLTYLAEVSFQRPPGKLINAALQRLFRLAARRAITRLQAMLSGSSSPPRLTLLTQLADQAFLPGLMGFTRAGYRWARNQRPVASILYAGRTIVLTGGTSGIGRAAARELYAKGAHLVVVGRDASKLEALRMELSETIKNGGRIETEIADLSLMAETRQLAERLIHRYAHVDVLINNAGALFNRYQQTTEGFEQTMALNLLTPYLLTRLLLPALLAAPSTRIINVASGGMYTQGLKIEDIHSNSSIYDGPTAYARAKRGLVTLAGIWARELSPWGTSVHAMHPGWVDTPGLERALPTFHNQISALLRTPAQGADTIVWLAASPDAARASGHFWLDRRIHSSHVLPGTRPSARDRLELVNTLNQLTEVTP